MESDGQVSRESGAQVSASRILGYNPKSIAVPPIWRGAGSGGSQSNPEKSSNFKAISRAPTIMKTDPKATKDQQNITMKSAESQHVGVVFAILLIPNIFETRTSRFRLEYNQRNKPGIKHDTKHMFAIQGAQKNSKSNHKSTRTIKIPAWIPKCPSLCSHMP